MIALLSQLDYHHWLILGFLLMTLEVFVGTAFFLWLSFASLSVGLLVLLGPLLGVHLSWKWQLVIFTVLATISVFGWKRYSASRPAPENHLNQRGNDYVGRIYLLEDAIVGGHGKLNIDDTIWKVNGPDIEANTKVKVIALTNGVLEVEAI